MSPRSSPEKKESLFSGVGWEEGGRNKTGPERVGEIEPRSSEDLMIELVVGGLQGLSLSCC